MIDFPRANRTFDSTSVVSGDAVETTVVSPAYRRTCCIGTEVSPSDNLADLAIPFRVTKVMELSRPSVTIVAFSVGASGRQRRSKQLRNLGKQARIPKCFNVIDSVHLVSREVKLRSL